MLPCHRRQLLHHRYRAFSSIAGSGSLACVFGGFGFTTRQISKHEAIYHEHGFETLPVVSTIQQLISPTMAEQRT